jgi:hypothetical protein
MARPFCVFGRIFCRGIKGRGPSFVTEELHARFPFLMAVDGLVRKPSANRRGRRLPFPGANLRAAPKS